MRFRRMAMLLAFVLTAANALAQSETGRIGGTLVDPQGGVTPGVTVTATSVGTGVQRVTVTDTSGRYVIANLPPATYDVTFELSGFKGVKNTVIVPVGADVAVNATLEVGNVTEQVTVTAALDRLNVRTPEFRGTIKRPAAHRAANADAQPVRPRRDCRQRPGGDS